MPGRTQFPHTREDILDAMSIGMSRVPTQWEKTLCMPIPSTTDRENVLFSGGAPSVVERTAPLTRDKIKDIAFSILNVTYDAIHRTTREAYMDDKVGRMLRVARELGVKIAAHPARLITDLVNAGTTGLGYDGAAFYADSHQHGAETAYDNKLASSGIDTLAHVITDVWAAINYFMGVKDDKGDAVFSSVEDKQFVIQMPPAAERFIREATSAQYLGDVSNVLVGRVKFGYWVDGNLSDSADWFMHCVTPDRKPFILQEREAPSDIFLGPDEPLVKAGKEMVTFGRTVRYAVAYGDPRCSVAVV